MTNTTYNGYTNYATWNFALWEMDYLQETIQDLQDQQSDKLEYGQVLTMVEGHIDNMLELQETPVTGFLSDILGNAINNIDCHNIATNIHDELDYTPEEE